LQLQGKETMAVLQQIFSHSSALVVAAAQAELVEMEHQHLAAQAAQVHQLIHLGLQLLQQA
jgi:hypothetical protein